MTKCFNVLNIPACIYHLPYIKSIYIILLRPIMPFPFFKIHILYTQCIYPPFIHFMCLFMLLSIYSYSPCQNPHGILEHIDYSAISILIIQFNQNGALFYTNLVSNLKFFFQANIPFCYHIYLYCETHYIEWHLCLSIAIFTPCTSMNILKE